MTSSMPVQHQGPDLVGLVRAATAIDRYSLGITALVDRVVGVGSSGNHEVQVLASLVAVPGRRPHDLMALTGLSRAGVAALVTRLERLRLVERVPGRTDRRTLYTTLTPYGRSRLDDLEAPLEQYFVESRTVVEEILDLLGGGATDAGPRTFAETALVAAGQLGAAGGPYVRDLQVELGAMPFKSRMALTALCADGALRPTQLAEILDLSSGGLTYLVDQLERDHLVQRSYGQLVEDRRAVVIELTDAGFRTANVIGSILDDHAEPIAAALARTLRQPAR
jgi:DNA-binding MarR family transcriptional regulator